MQESFFRGYGTEQKNYDKVFQNLRDFKLKLEKLKYQPPTDAVFEIEEQNGIL